MKSQRLHLLYWYPNTSYNLTKKENALSNGNLPVYEIYQTTDQGNIYSISIWGIDWLINLWKHLPQWPWNYHGHLFVCDYFFCSANRVLFVISLPIEYLDKILSVILLG